ncbi:hypothetical protein BDW69DRAFT_169421, partial [Aspergillus filifer]
MATVVMVVMVRASQLFRSSPLLNQSLANRTSSRSLSPCSHPRNPRSALRSSPTATPLPASKHHAYHANRPELQLSILGWVTSVTKEGMNGRTVYDGTANVCSSRRHNPGEQQKRWLMFSCRYMV